ncbi:hypothetical protein KC887_00750 [Candidatus Kaiserbacteria bacterium]|nr:hypothetical protein [Candidatus Kaiserbacteria bacterium]
MNTRKAYDEIERWQAELDTTAIVVDGEGHKKPISYILEKVFEEISLQIFKRDRDGNLEFDDKGRAKIDWISVITGLARLVGKIIFLRKIYDAESIK